MCSAASRVRMGKRRGLLWVHTTLHVGWAARARFVSLSACIRSHSCVRDLADRRPIRLGTTCSMVGAYTMQHVDCIHI